MLAKMVDTYEEFVAEGLVPVKMINKKENKGIYEARDGLLEQLEQNKCFDCEKLSYHLSQHRLRKTIKAELSEC